ncbi:hypothetical protein [Verrucosispora sp. WMMC514]|uniref:hypothetical protein n=1 Tax=Verrucosispora sp. WMMC514 TaxID=3015156 RepID=UPI00248BAAF2|nr:hypothetical protein [Verrucosispora sp. WMMC514]WBB94234.1 hypothetical protein O7597_15395 [Verrucosispora sp. WMMC514]
MPTDTTQSATKRTLHPTKTRIALLDEVRAGNVFRNAIGDSYIAAGRKVTAAIREMERARWVEQDDSRPGDYWRPTTTGREVLDDQATRYRVEFPDGIGRKLDVAPLGPVVSGPNHQGRIAEAVYRYASRFLISRLIAVDVDLAAGKGWIEGGRFGTFTVTRVGVE